MFNVLFLHHGNQTNVNLNTDKESNFFIIVAKFIYLYIQKK